MHRILLPGAGLTRQMTCPDIAGPGRHGRDVGVQVFLSSHHDDWDVTTPSEVTVTLADGAPGVRYRIYCSLVAEGHGNSYTVWDAMGRPQPPDEAQLATLAQAARLKTEPLEGAASTGDGVTVTFTLPSHCACLLQFVPVFE